MKATKAGALSRPSLRVLAAISNPATSVNLISPDGVNDGSGAKERVEESHLGANEKRALCQPAGVRTIGAIVEADRPTPGEIDLTIVYTADK